MALSQLNHFPERIGQHSPEKLGLDILRSLLTSTLTEIYNRHEGNIGASQAPWPSPDALDTLVEKFDLITTDQIFAILIALNFVNRGNPLERLDRLAQALCRRRTFWRLDSLHEWIFYIVCDTDQRANVCLRTLAIIGAAQQSGIRLTAAVITSILDITDDNLRNVAQDLHPLIVFRGVGHFLVFEASGGFITSCLQRDWCGEYNIDGRSEWRIDLTMNCIRRRNYWKADGK
jgi:hypothetical protein